MHTLDCTTLYNGIPNELSDADAKCKKTVYGPIPGKVYVKLFSPCSQSSDTLVPVQM